jgi:cleavage and polyadenylation specificity factor subunit 1
METCTSCNSTRNVSRFSDHSPKIAADQYADPKSLQGHLLIHRTTFNLGAHQTTHSLLLPNTSPTAQLEPYTNGTATNGTNAKPHPPHLLLLSSPTGVLATLTPLSEPSYRNLSTLSTQLANTLAQVAGLNPRAYRAPYPSSRNGNGAPGVDAGVGRTIVDGALLARWMELGSGRRGEIAARVVGGGGSGGSAEASLGVELVRRELEGVLGWGGMAYF